MFITRRIDDVINLARHRLLTAEMEEVVAAHPAVAECAVVGIADVPKRQIPVGFIVSKQGTVISPSEIELQIIRSVKEKIGPLASFKRVVITPRLPKIRSRKILRKIIRTILDGTKFNTPPTIEYISVLDKLKQLTKEKKLGILK